MSRRRGSRNALLLSMTQARYQLRLLARSPLSTFTIVIIPLLLLVTLNAVMPADALAALRGGRYVDFLTPAMATFALLNAAYINVITGVVLARDSGVLKRLRATPLPTSAQVAGRLVTAALTGALAAGVVVTVGVVLLDAHLDSSQLGWAVLLALLAGACLSVLGLAVSVIVPKPESALPIAYGTVLPLGFISDVFFPATAEPTWVHDLATFFPIAPIAHAAERMFDSNATGWPMTGSELASVLAWTAAGAVVAVAAFRWEPGPRRLFRRSVA